MSLLLASTLAWVGCSTVQHGYKIADVAERGLSTVTEEGKLRLQLELEYDSAVRDIVTKNGTPEWLYIATRDQVYLYYTKRDEVYVITRPMVPPGAVRLYERTPGFLLNLLPKLTVAAVLEERQVRQRAAKASTKRRSTARSTGRRRSAPPAAIGRQRNPSGSSLHDFNPASIVKRLRKPLSAADPGITQWSTGRLANGESARVATAGTTRYLVRDKTITVSAPIAPRGRSTSKRTRHAIHRINNAVFGTGAGSVDKHVRPLVSQVAGDTSGRTRIRRRVAGRTVSVVRDTDRGLLIYSVYSE